MVDAPNQPIVLAVRERIDSALQHFPPLYSAVLLGFKAAGLVRRRRRLESYLNSVPAEKRCLSIGSGPDAMDGWLCTDLVPTSRAAIYLDATRRWPLASASFRYITCEHMIEHVPYEAALRVLREVRRVLQSGGVLRISTPNLDVIRRLPDSDDSDDQDYVRWFNRTFGSAAQRAEEANPVHALNLVMHEFGHTYLYDEATLRRALTRAGFGEIVRCEPGMSRQAELAGVDRHGDHIPDAVNRVESLILEATA